MLRQISVRQFQEWRAYADLEPFDEKRADLRAASVVQAIRNQVRGKGRPAVKLNDCVLPFDDDPGARPPSVEAARKQVRQTMDVLVAMFNRPKRARRSARA